METMTEEEAFALDEYYTQNQPTVDPSKARIRIPMVRVDSDTAASLLSLARTTRKTPEEIVSELVRERAAAASM
jgi:hypothetical protein